MLPIMIESAVTVERLEKLGVRDWPVWECNNSDFLWHYEQREVCFIVEGEVLVTPDDGAPVQLQAGDLVLFPAGLSCRWAVLKPVKKHFRLG